MSIWGRMVPNNKMEWCSVGSRSASTLLQEAKGRANTQTIVHPTGKPLPVLLLVVDRQYLIISSVHLCLQLRDGDLPVLGLDIVASTREWVPALDGCIERYMYVAESALVAFTGPPLLTAHSHGTTHRCSYHVLHLVSRFHLRPVNLPSTLRNSARTDTSKAIDRHPPAPPPRLHAASQASLAHYHSNIRAGILLQQPRSPNRR